MGYEWPCTAGYSESWILMQFWSEYGEDAKWLYNILQLLFIKTSWSNPPSLLPQGDAAIHRVGGWSQITLVELLRS